MEIYAEVFFEVGSIGDEDFFSIVPNLIDAGFSEVDFAEAGIRVSFDPSSEETLVPERKTRVRCWLKDRSGLAQVAEDTIAVNLVGDYPGWSRFTELFRLVLDSTRAGLPDAQPRSINFVTIDRFRAPVSNQFRLGDFIQCGGKFIPAWYSDARANLDVNLGQGLLKQDGFNRKLALRLRLQKENAEFLLRASFHDLLEGKEPAEVLEALHAESNDTFEAIVTDRVREEVMGGVA